LTIAVTAVKVDDAHVARHREARAGEFVCVRVCDTGSGMTPDVLSHIFEPFFTTKGVGKGTGLGLVTVQRVAKQHSGWVEVQSQVGVGTEFAVYLPCAPRSPVKARNESVSMPPGNGTGTILLVEDEAAVRELASALLKRNGYQVIEADSGLAALEMWKEKCAQIDLLVTDMVMPGGVSGHDLAGYLLQVKPALKVVYTSGYGPDRTGQDSKHAEGVRFVPKPYTSGQLLQAIRDCLAVQPQSNPAALP